MSSIQPDRLDTILTNLTLLKREHPVVIQDEEFRLASFMDRICSRVSKPEDVTTLINKRIQDVVDVLDSSEEIKDDQIKRIRGVFFEAIYKYNYDRSLIKKEGKLERALDSEVYESHFQQDEVCPVTGLKVKETLLEAIFSIRLGIRSKVVYNPNVSESRIFIEDRNRNILGIFKKQHKGLWFTNKYGSAEEREAHLAEVGASKLSNLLGLNLVPYTSILKIYDAETKPPLTGSIQFYVKNAASLKSILELKTDNNQEIRSLKFTNFEEIAFLDMLLGNNDRHFENIMCLVNHDAPIQLVAIDNGNSFPWCFDNDLPSYKYKPLHTYSWRKLPQSESCFSENIRNWILNLDLQPVEETLRKTLVAEETLSSKKHIDDKIATLRARYSLIVDGIDKVNSIADIAESVLKGSLLSEPPTAIDRRSLINREELETAYQLRIEAEQLLEGFAKSNIDKPSKGNLEAFISKTSLLTEKLRGSAIKLEEKVKSLSDPLILESCQNHQNSASRWLKELETCVQEARGLMAVLEQEEINAAQEPKESEVVKEPAPAETAKKSFIETIGKKFYQLVSRIMLFFWEIFKVLISLPKRLIGQSS